MLCTPSRERGRTEHDHDIVSAEGCRAADEIRHECWSVLPGEGSIAGRVVRPVVAAINFPWRLITIVVENPLKAGSGTAQRRTGKPDALEAPVDTRVFEVSGLAAPHESEIAA